MISGVVKYYKREEQLLYVICIQVLASLNQLVVFRSAESHTCSSPLTTLFFIFCGPSQWHVLCAAFNKVRTAYSIVRLQVCVVRVISETVNVIVYSFIHSGYLYSAPLEIYSEALPSQHWNWAPVIARMVVYCKTWALVDLPLP